MAQRKGTALVVLAMLLVVVFVWARLWAHGERTEMPLLWQVAQSVDGRVFVLIGNQLHIESPSGQSLGVVDLGAFGVESIPGDLSVLSDNSILLPLGRLPRVTLHENLQVTAQLADERNTPSEPLQRCWLETMRCERLATGDDAYRAGRAYRFAVDEALERVVVADTARHRLLLLDMDGRIVDRVAERFTFPNQIQFTAPGEVTFAATRNSKLVTIAVNRDGFGDVLAETTLECWPGSLLRRYPSGFAQATDGARWAVVAMDAMTDAGLYRLRPGADCAEQVPLPPNADPFFLLATENAVLVPDTAAYRIHRFALDGAPLAAFGSPELAARLARLAERRERLTLTVDGSLWALLLVALPMMVFGYRQYQRDEAAAAPAVRTATNAPASSGPQADEPEGELLDSRKIGAAVGAAQAFKRRLTPLDTRTEFWLKVAFGTASYAYFVYDAAQAQPTGSVEGLFTFFANSNGFLAFAAVMALLFLLRVSVATGERLVVDRSGIRYTSFFNGPLAALNRLHPDWVLRWDQIRSFRLKVARGGTRPYQWLYEIEGADGERRVVEALRWRAADTHDGGAPLWRISSGTSVWREAVARTRLFMLLAQGESLGLATVSADGTAGGARYPRHYYEVFVGPRSAKYLGKWERRGFAPVAPGFHWPALLAFPFWLGYRKMYPSIALTAIATGAYFALADALLPLVGIDAELQTRLTGVAFAAACALFADSLYLFHVNHVIADVVSGEPAEEGRLDTLRRKGGTSWPHAVGGFVVFALVAGGAQQLATLLLGRVTG